MMVPQVAALAPVFLALYAFHKLTGIVKVPQDWCRAVSTSAVRRARLAASDRAPLAAINRLPAKSVTLEPVKSRFGQTSRSSMLTGIPHVRQVTRHIGCGCSAVPVPGSGY